MALPAQLVLVVTVDIIIAVGMIIGIAVGRHSGSPLAMTTIFTILFSTVPLFFSPSQPFLIKRLLESKN